MNYYRKFTPQRLVLLTLLFSLVLLLAWPNITTATSFTAAQQLQRAWQQALASGHYQYQTDLLQTIHPTAKLVNSGRQPQRELLRLTGDMDTAGAAMTLRMESGRGVNSRVIDLRVEEGVAYGRSGPEADWVEVDTDTSLFAPGGDPLGFVAAAENVRKLAPSTANSLFDQVAPDLYADDVTHYAFEINGLTFARHMRDQMERHLRQRGELPAGLRLEMADVYITMTGRGELWLNGDGLPVRQLIHLEFPPEATATEWVEAQITTNFTNWNQTGQSFGEPLTQLWQEPLRLFSGPTTIGQITSTAVGHVGLYFALCALFGSFVLLCIIYRRNRRFYALLASSIIVAMLVGPLLQTQQVSAFADRQAARQMAWEKEQSAQLADRSEGELSSAAFDPLANPLTVTDAPEASAVNHKALALPQTARQSADSTTDTDGDGLTDLIETEKLGTDPEDIDTDDDLISDRAEVLGFSGSNNQRWYLDPLQPDSNRDGQLDGLECAALIDVDPTTDSIISATGTTCVDTDGDGVPDVFDHDNDGDGVPDRQDSSPNYRGALTTQTQDQIALSLDGYDTSTARPVAVTLELRPTRYEDLYQSHNVLDWPDNDTAGQVVRVNDNTFADLSFTGPQMAHGDMLLAPMLEILIPAPATNSANPSGGLPVKSTFNGDIATSDLDLWLDTDLLDEYSITASQDQETGEIYAYLPLTLIEDENGGAPLAWGTQMVYRPQSGSFGLDHQMRMVWHVQALTDTCDTSTMGDSDKYDEWCALDSGHWVSQISVIQAYYEPFYLTGLMVQESHAFVMSAFAQKDALTQPYADDLWHLASILMDSFAEGKLTDVDGDSSEDDRFDVHAATERFGPNGTGGTIWGVDTTNLSVQSMVKPDQVTGLRHMVDTFVPQMLQGTYQNETALQSGDTATLLFAKEEAFKTVGLAQLPSGNVVDNGNGTLSIKATLANQPVQTYATVHWTPYNYDGLSWSGADIFDQVTRLENNLATKITDADIQTMMAWQGVTSKNLAAAKLGAIALARGFYLALWSGSSQVVADSTNALRNNAVINAADYSRDFDGDGNIDETWLFYVATTAGLMQSYFQRAEEPLLDEFNEVLENLGLLENENDEIGGVDSTAILITSIGKGVKGAIKKAIKLFYTVEGAAKYYKGRGKVSKAVTAASLTTFAIGIYIGISGDTRKGMVLALDTVGWTSEIINMGDTFVTFYKVGKGYDDMQTTLLTTEKLKTSTRLTAAIGASFDIAISSLFFGMAVTDLEPGSFAFNAFASLYIAEIITALISAVIALTVIGSVVLAIVDLIDLAASLICRFGGNKESDDVKKWVCGGIGGAFTQALVYALYDMALVADLGAKNRLDFVLNPPEFAPGATASQNGIMVGNSVALSMQISNTLKMSKPAGLGDFNSDNFFKNETLKRSTFTYTLQTSETAQYNLLQLGDLASEWTGEQNKIAKVFSTAHTFVFQEAGVNRPPSNIYLTESYKLPALECWGFVVQDCQRRVQRDAIHIDFTDEIVFDVFPATFTDFVAMNGDVGGYRMGWSGDEFPLLYDADGDGLVSQSYGGPDPNDSLPDSDLDGLSDFAEYRNGSDLLNQDGDRDGLSDYWELVYNTNPRRADSDADGLLDGEEVFHPTVAHPYKRHPSEVTSTTWSGGWTIVYDRVNGTPLRTLVTANPLDEDADGDFISDAREKVYGYNPFVAESLNVLSLDSSVAADVVAPNANLAYTTTVKNELDNRIANGLLQAEFPVDLLQSTAVMQTLSAGERVTTTGTVNAPNVNASDAMSLTLRAGAVFEDPYTGRVLWLHLNETGSPTTFADDAQSDGGPHNATCSGDACPTPEDGHLVFDGGDRLTVAAADELNVGAFTASFWVQRDNTSSSQTLLAKGNSFSVAVADAVVPTLYLDDCTTAVSLTDGGTLPTGNWQHVAVTYNGATLRLYYNGVQRGSDVTVGSLCHNNNAITIGNDANGNGFQGKLDEIELYPRALSTDEVVALTRKQPVFYLPRYTNSTATAPSRQFSDASIYGQASISCANVIDQDTSCPTEATSNNSEVFVFDERQSFGVWGTETHQLGANNNNFTISLWMQPDWHYTGDNAHLYEQGQLLLGYEGFGYEKAYPSLYHKGKGFMVRFGHADGNGYCEATSADVLSSGDETWQHVSVAFDGNVFDLYLNGVLADSFSGNNCAGQELYATSKFYIGHPKSTSLNFRQIKNIDMSQGQARQGFIMTGGSAAWESFTWENFWERVDNKGRRYNTVDWSLFDLVWNSPEGFFREGTSPKIGSLGAWGKAFRDESTMLGFILCYRHKPQAETPEPISCGPELDEDQRWGPWSHDLSDEVIRDTFQRFVKAHTYYEAPGNKSVEYITFPNDRVFTLDYRLHSTGFKGKLDEIRLYANALTDEEASELYKGSVRSLELTFDEPPGQDIFEDTANNGFDAVCGGVGINAPCPDSGIPGRSNQAARFDGNNDVLTLASAADVSLTDASFTVMAWVQGDNLSGDRALLGTDQSNVARQDLFLGVRNSVPYMSFGGGIDLTGATTLQTGKWYHLAYVYNSDTKRQQIYLNGTLDAQATANQSSFLGTGTLRVGQALGGNAFDGMIDHLVIVKTALGASGVAAVMREAPVLTLHLDEDLNTGRFVDDTPRANHAICTGAACPEAGSKGQMREAAVFNTNGDSTSDLLTVPHNTAYDLNTYTVGLWVKPRNSQPNVQHLVGKRDPSTGGSANYSLLLHPNNTIELSMQASNCGTWQILYSAATLAPNQWNHVMGTFDGETMKLYINGSLDANTKTFTGTPCQAAVPITLGSSGAVSGWSPIDGEMDEVTVYGTALFGSQVEAIYDYQNAWYDTTTQHLIAIDADLPQVRLDVTATLPLRDSLLTISAVDTTSHVERVTVTIQDPNGATSTQAAVADGNAWLLPFSPTVAGDYTFSLTATDTVGNVGSTSKRLTVDNTPPGLTVTTPNRPQAGMQTVTVGGSVADTASHVPDNGVRVDLLDAQGTSVNGSHTATLTDTNWRVDYPFPLTPYGQYTVQVTAEDGVGNETVTATNLALDGLGAIADVTMPIGVISDTAALVTGTASDLPYPLANRLLHLHFEESDNATDFVDGSKAHATITCTICPTAGGAGRYGSGVAFDGIDDRLPLPALLNPATDGFTAALWFNLSSLGTEQTLVQQRDGTGSGQLWLMVDSAGQLSTMLGGGLSATGIPPLTTNRWHHGAVSFDGTTLSLYLDGTVVAQAEQPPTAADGALLLGIDQAGTNAFHGVFDELVIYASALPDDVIYDMANPLQGAVTSAQIRFRAMAEGELAADEGTWSDLTLTALGNGFATWQQSIPTGVEAPYKIDLQVSDAVGNSRMIANAWSGEFDTAAPNVQMDYLPSADFRTATVTCTAEDFNLSTSGWNCPTMIPPTHGYQDAPWFTNIFTDVQKLSTLSATGMITVALNPTLTACDLYGHCTTVSAPVTPLTLTTVPTAPIPFDGSTPAVVGAVFAGLDANLHYATWYWGDGTESAATLNGTTIEGSHVYSNHGTYTVYVVVRAKADDALVAFTIPYDGLVINAPPTVTTNVMTTTVQYSDAIQPITVTINDIDSAGDNLALATVRWSRDGVNFVDGLPADLTLSEPVSNGLTLPGVVTQVLSGFVTLPAGNYIIRLAAQDEYAVGNALDLTIAVAAEEATLRFHGGNVRAVQVPSDGDPVSGPFTLQVDITESYPDNGVAVRPGDLTLAEGQIQLVPIGPGAPAEPTSCSTALHDVDYDQRLTLACTFDAVPVNTYAVGVTDRAGYYASPAESVITVYDPGLGSAAGSGRFLWPDTVDETSFAFDVAYNKRGKNLQGDLRLIRHLADGSQLSIESNALDALSIGAKDDYTWASFSGKATYRVLGTEETEGNYTVIVYVEDHGEENDHIWLEVKDRDGNVMTAFSLRKPATAAAAMIDSASGNIVVDAASANGSKSAASLDTNNEEIDNDPETVEENAATIFLPLVFR